jgi:hypothetical protein
MFIAVGADSIRRLDKLAAPKHVEEPTLAPTTGKAPTAETVLRGGATASHLSPNGQEGQLMQTKSLE